MTAAAYPHSRPAESLAYPPGLAHLAFGIFAVLSLASLFLAGPQVQVDEGSYLLTAAAIAGKLTVHGVNGYYSGYSFLLLPALWFGSGPPSAYHAALLINAALVATTPFALYRLTCRLYPTIDARWHVAAAIATTCHASVLLLSQHAMSENALIPLYAWLLACAATALLDMSVVAAALCGCIAGALFLVHPRGGAIAFPLLVLMILPAFVQARGRRLIAASWLAMLAVVALHIPLERLATKQAGLGAGYAPGSIIHRLGEPTTWLSMALNFLGSATEAIVASFGVLVIGAFAIGTDLWRRETRQQSLPRATVLVALLAGLGAGFLMSTIFFLPPQRADQIAYGRYALPTVLPIVAIGLLQFSRPVNPRTRAAFIGMGTGAVCIALMAFAFTRLPKAVATSWIYINAPSLYLAQWLVRLDAAWAAIAVCFAAVAVLLCIALAISGRAALLIFVVANIFIAALGWYEQTWRLSHLYAENRRVVEAVNDFEAVTGSPLCVELSPRMIGWHGVDLRWRLFDHMADYARRNASTCVMGTVDYLAGRDAAGFGESLIATERPPPGMDDSIGLFVGAGSPRDRWRNAGKGVSPESYFPMPESEQRAELSILEPASAIRLRVGDTLNVIVLVTNTSAHSTWPAIQDGPYPIWLGARAYHRGMDRAFGEYRTRLKTSVGPESRVEARIVVGPFTEKGAYRVEVGMLQEAIAWFPNRSQLEVEVDDR